MVDIRLRQIPRFLKRSSSEVTENWREKGEKGERKWERKWEGEGMELEGKWEKRWEYFQRRFQY